MEGVLGVWGILILDGRAVAEIFKRCAGGGDHSEINPRNVPITGWNLALIG